MKSQTLTSLNNNKFLTTHFLNNKGYAKVKSAPSKSMVVWIYLLAFILMTWSFKSFAAPSKDKAKKVSSPIVTIETTLGSIKVKLNSEKAPISTANFLKYVDKKFYDKTIFHRVIGSFMIQGGGHLEDMTEKPTLFPPIKNEAKNGLSNLKYTVAMARTNETDSATAQFFINVVDNTRLDHKSEQQYGYAVFGEVISGQEVVDQIKDVKTIFKGDYADVPEKTILIKSIRRN